jgi:metallo-beta-lactamase class B
MSEKFASMKDGAANPFVDAEGYKRYIAEREAAFREEWKKQQGQK